MYRIPPKVTPLTPYMFLGRSLTITQAELVLVSISVEERWLGDSYPPATRKTWQYC